MYNHTLALQKSIKFAPKLSMKIGKIHECCGPAKIRMAIMLATSIKGQIIWIRPNWEVTTLNIDGLSSWFSTERFLLINVKNKNDLIYCLEEVLRSGSASVTIADLPEIPKPIPMRRFKIAMKKGLLLNKNKSMISLILTPKKGGAQNVESRWFASNLPSWHESKNNLLRELKQKWLVTRLFSRTEPPAKWVLEATEYGDGNHFPKLILNSTKLPYFFTNKI